MFSLGIISYIYKSKNTETMAYQNLLILASFILLYSVFAKKIEASVISGPFLALAFGVLFGPLLLNLFQAKVETEEYRIIAELALALVLFTDASKANLNVLEHNVGLPVRLLLIGLPLTIGFGVLGGFLVFKGFSWIELGILATMLAPTDAALGKAVVSNPLVPKKIRESLNVESGLNDGICVPVLFLLIAFFATQSGEDLSSFYGLQVLGKEIGIGLLAGFSLSFLGFRLIQFSAKRQWLSKSWETMLIVALSFSSFSLAQIMGGSGFIACFAGGFLFGVLRRKSDFKEELMESAEGTGDTFSLITWLIFGSLVIASNLHELTWQVALYGILSLTIIRMFPVFLALISTGLSGKEKAFMGWFGPRGLASIVFAIMVLEVDLPHKSTIILTVAFTIMLSVVLHGFTAKPLIKGLTDRKAQAN